MLFMQKKNKGIVLHHQVPRRRGGKSERIHQCCRLKTWKWRWMPQYRVAQKSRTFHFHSLYRNVTYVCKANV